jgi:addiction module toxin, txe/yoeB family
MYRLRISEEADHDLSRLKKHEPQAFKKALQLLEELTEHPQTGTGHPELLKGDRPGQWSRRISKKHRLVYEIQEEIVLVLVLRAYGHYDDK